MGLYCRFGHPINANSWKDTRAQRTLQYTRGLRLDADMCQFSMRHIDEKREALLRKPTKFRQMNWVDNAHITIGIDNSKEGTAPNEIRCCPKHCAEAWSKGLIKQIDQDGRLDKIARRDIEQDECNTWEIDMAEVNSIYSG